MRNLRIPSLLLPALFLFMVSGNLAAVDQAAIEAEAKQLENLIIAPCCWRQAVAVHYSPSADEIRKDVRTKLAAGMSRQQILDEYIAKYGERILSKPPAKGFGRLAYFLPVLVLLAGGLIAFVVIRRLRPTEMAPEAAPKAAVPSGYADRLDKELWG